MACTRGATNLEKSITEMKATDAEKLTYEDQKLVEGLQEIDDGRQGDLLDMVRAVDVLAYLCKAMYCFLLNSAL